MEREVEMLAASLGITYEEAKDMLRNDELIFVECICPFTGTIEYMEVNNELRSK